MTCVGLSPGQYSTFQYTTTPENQISSITETSDAATVYPAGLTQTASYNNLNQLTNLSGQVSNFDANGNLLSDGPQVYSWDAENRLIGITYPGQPSKKTVFTYDGLGRRTAIASTPPGGGSTVAISYVWCGSRPCQARNGNMTAREYYGEGEFVPGSPAQPYYYAPDQIGSVRRVFANASSAPAYSYDPYGNPLQAAAPLTDFGYAGMFRNAESGLSLTLSRAYDPVVGRWLSRDPLGERSDATANLYVYVRGDPLNLVDWSGLCSSDPQVAQWVPPLLFEEPPVMVPEPPLEQFPTDPAQPPGAGYEWRGAPGSNPGDNNGNWYNPNTGESIHPDLQHEPPIGPHMDYKAPDGKWYRWFPDNAMREKA